MGTQRACPTDSVSILDLLVRRHKLDEFIDGYLSISVHLSHQHQVPNYKYVAKVSGMCQSLRRDGRWVGTLLSSYVSRSPRLPSTLRSSPTSILPVPSLQYRKQTSCGEREEQQSWYYWGSVFSPRQGQLSGTSYGSHIKMQRSGR